MPSLDLTEIITAVIAAVAAVLVVWLPLRWGKKAASDADQPLPPAEHRSTVEYREHERTRDLIRDQTGEVRNLFLRLENLVLGRPKDSE